MARKTAVTPYSQILEEVNEGHSIRKHLYEELEQQLEHMLHEKCLVIAFFVSFRFPAVIEDQDGDMIEEILQNSDMAGKRLVLILNSPGGLALPAERIVNICRSHSHGGRFTVIVPKMAKSAATMVCLGASEICMSPTSELGPIDPQMPVYDDQGRLHYQAAHETLRSYNELMTKANRTKGRIEPYLQQLQRYDAREIHATISATQLSEKIAITTLRTGMFYGRSASWIRSRIRPFLDPKHTVVHGRPIYRDLAKQCRLNVRMLGLKSTEWRTVWNLYVRLNHFSTRRVAKVIESLNESYIASPIQEGA